MLLLLFCCCSCLNCWIITHHHHHHQKCSCIIFELFFLFIFFYFDLVGDWCLVSSSYSVLQDVLLWRSRRVSPPSLPSRLCITHKRWRCVNNYVQPPSPHHLTQKRIYIALTDHYLFVIDSTIFSMSLNVFISRFCAPPNSNSLMTSF